MPMEGAIHEIEQKDGIRMTWNVFPTKRPDYNRQPIPIGILYSPNQPAPILQSDPLHCTTPDCRTVLNPYARMNFQSQDWQCQFCNKRNILPGHYRDMTADNLSPELMESNTTVVYELPRESVHPFIFIFVVDICFFDSERRRLGIDALLTAFNNLPDDSYVGLITFGTNVELFDLSDVYEKESKFTTKTTYLFSGKKEYNKDVIKKMNKSVVDTFVVKKSDVKEKFIDILEGIEKDPFPVANGYRSTRSTGSALTLAHSISTSFPDTGAKYFLFTQGPCTYGPGTIASIKLSENIRSYTDILQGKSIYTKPSIDFYTRLGNSIAQSGHSVDIIATTLYDVGIFEMKILTDLTSGTIIMAQDFSSSVYLSSIDKYTKDIKMNCMYSVKCKGLVYKGFLCQGVAGDLKNKAVLRNNGMCKNSTFLFDSVDSKDGDIAYIQVAVSYQVNKKLYKRVTTLARQYSSSREHVLSGFDQEAAMVVLSRIFTSARNVEEDIDLIRRVDRVLVKFLKSNASYQTDSPTSVRMPQSMSFIPNFVFFFRRSFLVQCESISPDESAYHRTLAGNQPVTETMMMIVPSLTSYHYTGTVGIVEMDSSSLNPEVVLLFDSFHNVVVWRGSHVANWMKERIYEKEEYKFIKELCDKVEAVANEVVVSRFPTPPLTICDQNTSQERWLLARVNPSKNGVLMTDDLDFNSFFECLCKCVVSGS